MSQFQDIETTTAAGATLPRKPSLKDELIARGVPGAKFFPDDDVEQFSIEGTSVQVDLKRPIEVELEKGLKVKVAKKVCADLVDDGITNVRGITVSKKILFTSIEAAILGIRQSGSRITVSLDNELFPKYEFDAGSMA